MGDMTLKAFKTWLESERADSDIIAGSRTTKSLLEHIEEAQYPPETTVKRTPSDIEFIVPAASMTMKDAEIKQLKAHIEDLRSFIVTLTTQNNELRAKIYELDPPQVSGETTANRDETERDVRTDFVNDTVVVDKRRKAQ